ncbi:hypothetical protein ACFXTN_018316 [Malus domestica]
MGWIIRQGPHHGDSTAVAPDANCSIKVDNKLFQSLQHERSILPVLQMGSNLFLVGENTGRLNDVLSSAPGPRDLHRVPFSCQPHKPPCQRRE